MQDEYGDVLIEAQYVPEVETGSRDVVELVQEVTHFIRSGHDDILVAGVLICEGNTHADATEN